MRNNGCEQRGAGCSAPRSQGGFLRLPGSGLLGGCWLMLLHRAVSPGSLPLQHPKQSGKRKWHVSRVCQAVPCSLHTASRAPCRLAAFLSHTPLPRSKDGPCAGGTQAPEPLAAAPLGQRELGAAGRGGLAALAGTCSKPCAYLSPQQSTAGSCNGDIFNF